jgi:AcrR family transcriptional regulator
MEHENFDKALVGAAFDLAASRGWTNVTVAEAARAANLPLAEARLRFPGRTAILLRLGRMADAAALAGTDGAQDGSARDRLFDIVMRRIDVFQAHRAGVLALFKALPADPATALMLWGATLRSMAWLLDGAGISPTGLDRTLRAHGLAVVWVSVIRAWMGDESADLAATMAALDRALDRAEQMSGWLGMRRGASTVDAPTPDVAEAEPFEAVAPEQPAPTPILPRTTPPPPPDVPASPPM